MAKATAPTLPSPLVHELKIINLSQSKSSPTKHDDVPRPDSLSAAHILPPHNGSPADQQVRTDWAGGEYLVIFAGARKETAGFS